MTRYNNSTPRFVISGENFGDDLGLLGIIHTSDDAIIQFEVARPNGGRAADLSN